LWGDYRGRFAFTRLFYSDANELYALDRLEEHYKPSPQQLSAFLGAKEQDQRAAESGGQGY
jgi:hypothetical protein